MDFIKFNEMGGEIREIDYLSTKLGIRTINTQANSNIPSVSIPFI